MSAILVKRCEHAQYSASRVFNARQISLVPDRVAVFLYCIYVAPSKNIIDTDVMPKISGLQVLYSKSG
jgi:hypothetical protein